MTCKDCVHYEVCKDDVELYHDSYDCLEVDGVEKHCEYFKPKSRFVEVKHGEWHKVRELAPRYVCSCCNHLNNNMGYKYCPNCGAKMDLKAR